MSTRYEGLTLMNKRESFIRIQVTSSMLVYYTYRKKSTTVTFISPSAVGYKVRTGYYHGLMYFLIFGLVLFCLFFFVTGW